MFTKNIKQGQIFVKTSQLSHLTAQTHAESFGAKQTVPLAQNRP